MIIMKVIFVNNAQHLVIIIQRIIFFIFNFNLKMLLVLIDPLINKMI